MNITIKNVDDLCSSDFMEFLNEIIFHYKRNHLECVLGDLDPVEYKSADGLYKIKMSFCDSGIIADVLENKIHKPDYKDLWDELYERHIKLLDDKMADSEKYADLSNKYAEAIKELTEMKYGKVI